MLLLCEANWLRYHDHLVYLMFINNLLFKKTSSMTNNSNNSLKFCLNTSAFPVVLFSLQKAQLTVNEPFLLFFLHGYSEEKVVFLP